MDKKSIIPYNKICAVIHAQGYNIHNQFHPKEVAIVSNKLTMCVSCDVSERSRGRRDRMTFDWVRKYIGMPWDSREDHWRKIDKGVSKVYSGADVILMMYQWVQSENQPLIAIKNPQLIPLLKMWNIPYVELNEEMSVKENYLYLLLSGNRCQFHCNDIAKCALSKAYALWHSIMIRNK